MVEILAGGIVGFKSQCVIRALLCPEKTKELTASGRPALWRDRVWVSFPDRFASDLAQGQVAAIGG